MFNHIELLKELFTQQVEYQRSLDPSFFSEFLKKQKPFITMVTCSDSRVQPEVFGINPINNIFSVRNIGNQLITTLGSVDYGVNHLRTPLLIILGHVRCGAITSALQGYEKETFATIRELNNLCHPIGEVKKRNFKRFHDMVEAAVLENIHYQVDLALKRYRRKVESGDLTVVGALYDFANLYGKGKGRVLIVNLNGFKDRDEILNRVPGEERDLWGEFLNGFFVSKSWEGD